MTLILSGTNGVSDIDGDASTPAIRGTDANSGIFFGADQVGVATNGVERVEFGNSETVFNDGGADVDFRVEGDTDANLLFVDASTDRVGIGTSSPVRNLQIGTYGTGNNEIAIASATSGLGSVLFGDGATSTDVYRGYLQYEHANDAMTIGTAATERARITSGGYSKFTTNGNYTSIDTHQFYQSNTNQFALLVAGLGTYTSTVLVMQGTNATSTSFNLIQGYTGGNTTTGSGASLSFQVRGDGNVTNTNNSYGSISDVKLKKDVVDAGSQWDDIKNLRVRKYRWKSDPDGFMQMGLVAQEAEEISPGLVEEHPDYEEVEVTDEEGNTKTERQTTGTTTKSVKYSVLYMKAVKALQEAMERIETLEAKVAALEANNV